MIRAAIVIALLLVAVFFGLMAWIAGIHSGAECGTVGPGNRHDAVATWCIVFALAFAFVAGVGAG